MESRGSATSELIDDEARALRVGRFAGRLYGAAGSLTLLWALVPGTSVDWWLIGFVVSCAAGALVTLLPWDGHGELLTRLMVAGAGILLALFMPFFIELPALLLLPALSATYIGAAVNRRWMLTLVPGAIALGAMQSTDRGAIIDWSSAGLYLGLWITVGSVTVWMRGQVEAGNRALLEAQAETANQAEAEAVRQAEAAAQAEAVLQDRIELAASLHRLVGQIDAASSSVEGQSSTIATAVEQLAMALNETLTTADKAGGSVQQIATATAESQSRIGQLDQAGQRIVGIVDTIADLSRQTNLLALNATIEAARAGEAGRGFAIVANEVKELAQLTATSASSIGEVIDQVHDRVTDSATAMGAVADLVAELESNQSTLGQSVAEQTQVVAGISSAAATGAEGVAQIGQAIRQLDESARRLDQPAS